MYRYNTCVSVGISVNVLVGVTETVTVGVRDGVRGRGDGEIEMVGRAVEVGEGNGDSGATIGRQAESHRLVSISIKKGITAQLLSVLRIGII